MMLEDKLWEHKYRPRTLADCLLPSAERKTFESYVKDRLIPNMLLSGLPGIGKTTVARAVLDDIEAEYIVIPASTKGNIDTLRNEIQQFASTIALNGERKYVIFDEADNLTHATQLGLRGFIEEFSKNCGFIFTCNFREKIIDAIADSRLIEVRLLWPKEERGALAKGLFLMLTTKVFPAEGIEFEPKDVQKFIVEHLNSGSDIRKLMLKAQSISRDKKFDISAKQIDFEARLTELADAIKGKNFAAARTWIGENADIDPPTIYRFIYDSAKSIANPTMVGGLVLIIAKYQYQQAFVADSEINLAACMVELMMEVV